MNTSVSPLPLPTWPLLALSLCLLVATTAGVMYSSLRAVQAFNAQPQPSLEAPAMPRNAALRSRNFQPAT